VLVSLSRIVAPSQQDSTPSSDVANIPLINLWHQVKYSTCRCLEDWDIEAIFFFKLMRRIVGLCRSSFQAFANPYRE
jgi:hypothetical protein